MSEKLSLQEQVRERFRLYLVANGLRQTRERFAILEAIYEQEGTFTIDDLSQIMQMNRFHVSTNTLYLTTQLLVEANLLIRHPFSSSAAVFERITDERPRSYQICSHCHRITAIKSKELASSLETYHSRSFSISHRVAYVYGLCASCQRKMHKRIKAVEAKNNAPKQ